MRNRLEFIVALVGLVVRLVVLLAIGMVGGGGLLPVMEGAARVRRQASQPWLGGRWRMWQARRVRRGKATGAGRSTTEVAPSPAPSTERDEAGPAELPVRDPAR